MVLVSDRLGLASTEIERGMDVGGGVEWIRREHDIVVAYNND